MNAIARAKKIELDAKLHNSYVVLSSFEWICTNISSSTLRFCLYFNCFLFLSSAERLRPPANCCVFGCTINDCSQNERIHKTHSTLRQIYEGTVFIYTAKQNRGKMKTQRKLLRAYFCTHLDSVRVHGSFLSSSSIEFGSLLFVSIMSNSNRKFLVEAHSRI